MVTVYFDASYNHPNPNSAKPFVHTVAGYVGAKSDWDKFRKEWRIELRKKNLDYFHMTDFEYARSQVIAGKGLSSKSQYYGWSENEFVPFLQRLHRVIRRKNKDGKYRLEGVVSHVLIADYNETLPDDLRNDPRCCTPYIFNVSEVIKLVADWANRHNYNNPIHYIFAGGDREDGNLKKMFVDMWNDLEARHLYCLSKDSSHVPYDIQMMKAEPALQAADVIAFEMQKGVLEWIERDFADIPISELRKSLASLCHADHWGLVYRKDELLGAFGDLQAHRFNLASSKNK